MLRSRIIPCLLIHNKGLVKTVQFKESKYVGDPINAVKIFNEKDVDEIMVLDIDASVEKRAPNMDLIRDLAIECRMPLCYGGGVKTVEQVKKIISLGAEKVALSSAVIENPNILFEISSSVGAQSVVIVLDVAKKGLFGQYEIFTLNGKKRTGIKLIDFLNTIKDLPFGELVINSIDLDGTMKGYDHQLVEIVKSIIDTPITLLGGAGSIDDIKELIQKNKIIGAAAGSLFVFKGKYRAVLINYPNIETKFELY